MADTEGPSGLALLPGDQILVTVQSALPDIIVVSFERGLKSFQGALLDATKRGLPCGIQSPEPINGPDGDKLASIAARFSYFQDKKWPVLAAKIDLRRNINPPARYKHTRPTVRLRPRQVLCSKCRSICNENSENVDVSKKRRHETPRQVQAAVPPRRSDRRTVQQANLLVQQRNQRALLREFRSASKPAKNVSIPENLTSIMPKLTTLRTRQINQAMQNGGDVQGPFWGNEVEDSAPTNAEPNGEAEDSSEIDTNATTAYCATPRRLSSSSVESAKVPEEDEKRTLAAADSTMKTRAGRAQRKKRSVGSMEDLWDESVFEDASRSTRSTPVIKISFGSQGAGTVLKIPSKEMQMETDSEEVQQEKNQEQSETVSEGEKTDSELVENGETDIDEQEQVDPQKGKIEKAAKRAMKKAKKAAKRKMLGTVSPARSPCTGSPRYNPNFDSSAYHRRRHKVKHKKKHKDDRKHKPAENKDEAQNWNVLPGSDSYTAIKEQCLKQKLSISLKRLNTNAYARCDYPVSNASSGCKSRGASSDELSEQEPEVDAGETAPDFPPPSHPLMMRLSATPVAHCLTTNGRRMDVGDVVWGKIHGFPWWPGKVLSITMACKEDGTSGPQAHVAWYGSSTSSVMSCDQLSPFLETFKARYNKKKRGPYKEAIRQAQNEARSQTSLNSAESVLNVCGSPREVNVVS